MGMNIIQYTNYFIDYTVAPPDTVCISQAIDTAFVQAQAVCDAGSNESVCQGDPFDFNSSFILPQAASYDSLLWTGGIGTFSDPTDLRPVYFPDPTEQGDISLTLTAYGMEPCADATSSMILTLDTVPDGTIGVLPNDTVCINEVVSFTGTDNNFLSIQSWEWNFGDGNTSVVQNPTHTYTAATTANVRLIITTNQGCKDTTYFTLEVMNPTIDFTSSPNPSCIGDTVWFTGSGNASFTEWTWDFGDGNTAMGKDVWHIYTAAGNQAVVLNVCSKTASHQHQVVPPALAEAGSSEFVCESAPFNFASAATPAFAADYQNIQWFALNGTGTFNNSTIIHPIYTPPAGEFGTFDFMLVAYGIQPCSNDTSYMTLGVFDGPEADYTITPLDSICVGESISLDATSTTTIIDWQWRFGDGNTANGQNVTHTYAAPGNYNIRLIVINDDNCRDTVRYPVEVFELPVADFTVAPANTICRLEEFSFFGASSTNILDWYWDFGDGATANTQNATHTYTTAGLYDVSLYVYNENSCRDTLTQQVEVFELPTCDFTISPNDSSCVNELITFNGTGTADVIAWDWNFDDGNTGTGQVVNHTFTSTGTYNVRLIVTNNNGCLDTMYHQRVVVAPVIDFNMDLSPSCEGYTVNLSGIGNYAFTDYVWDFGDGNNAIGKNTSHTYTTANTYTITLTFCTSQVQHDILVNPLPTAFAGQDTASCEDVPFDLSTLPIPPAAADYSSVMWFGGLGTFNDPTLIAPIYTPEDNEYNVNVNLYMVAYGIDPCHNDTSWMTIYVTQGAYAFAGSDESSCMDEPYNFANSAQPPAAYNELNRMWSGGAGTFVDPTAEVPIYIPAPGETGAITMTFIASNILNCDSMDQMVLTINPTYYQTQNFDICWGDSLQLPGGEWVYSTGFYHDTLMTVDNCDSIFGIDVFQYPKIAADFAIGPRDSACIDEDVFFTKTGPANLVSYLWDFGDGNTSNDLNPVHAYISAGTYTVTFSYTDNLGCSDQVTHDVLVFEHPDVDFTSSMLSACINAEFNFYGSSADDIVSWDWDFGDGTTGAGQNVSHIYTIYGPITVSLRVVATSGCESILEKTIFVAAPPTSDFTYNITSCDTIQFTDLSAAPQGYFLVEWLWYFDDGTTSNLQHPAHAYSTGGVYNVSLVVWADSAGLICTDSIAKPVLVPDRPTVYFSWSPEPTCLGDVTNFFGTSGNPITKWYWDFDDGHFATTQNPEHTYTAPGVYNVMLRATDQNGCWDTITHDVTVSDIPDVSFSVDPNPGCAGEQTSFSGSTTAVNPTWLWDFGDGGSSVNQNPVHVYASAGTYQVTLWVGDTANCFNATSQWIVINPMPLPNFTASQGTCSGDTTFFYNQSVSPNGSISQWRWDFGDGNSVTINAPNDPDVFHIYATGGTYNVTLTVVDVDSCSNFIIKPVTVADGPTADFNYEDNCNGQPLVFTDISTPNAGSPIVSWYWEFDDPPSGGANTSTQQNPTHLFTSPGTYDVLLRVTNVEGCPSTVVLPVEVSMVPQVSFTTDGDSACVMGEISFFGQASTSVTWSWDFGDGGVSVLQEPVHVYANPGTYNVVLTVEAGNGCINSYTSQVYINPLPIADFTVSSLPCSGSAVEFFDISSPMNAYMSSWHWYFGDGTDTIIYAPSNGNVAHTYTAPGPYTVSLAIENSNTCQDSIAYQVVVIQGPEAMFDYSGGVCQGASVAFTDMSQGFGSVVQSWSWNFGDPASGSNNTSTLQNPTHVFSASGSFAVTLTVTANTGCQHSFVDTLEIAPPPPVDWYMSPDTACLGDITYFFTDTDTTDVSRVVSFLWEFDDPASGANNTSDLQDPVHIYNTAGTYIVTLTITDVDGCENSSIHPVEINPPPIADYSYEQSCLGDSTLFFDESVSQTAVITSWQWNFGDPASGAMNTSVLQNTGHVFTDLGTYNVQLITTDYFGCSDTIIKTLVVDYAPTSSYTYNQPCQPPGLIFFNDSSYTQVGASPIIEWLWELEPGQFSSEINPIYTFQQQDTTYVVYLTVTDANGCENTFMDSVRVDEPLVMDFSATRVCHGDTTFFKGSYGPGYDQITSWRWELGDGNTLVTTEDSLFYQYALPGTYYVTVTVENQQRCEVSESKQVIVDALPAVDFSFSAALCDEPTQFTDLTNPGSGASVIDWQWNFGDVASGDLNLSSAQNPEHSYPAVDSTYQVSLVVTNSHGCVDSTSLSVTKGLCMQAIFEPSGDDQCNNTQVCFKDSSYIVGDGYAIQTWLWAFGDGQQMQYNTYMDSVCHEYAQSGQYTVSLTVSTEIGGTLYSDVTYQQIIISAVPVAEMALQSPCALGHTRFFDISQTNGVEIVGWQWDFGVPQTDSDTSSLKNPVYSYSESGTYSVQLIVENQNGCMDTMLMDINVYNAPEAGFTTSIACAGGTTEFTDESTPAEGELTQWLWNFGNGETSGQQDPWHVYSDTGDFLVQMVVTDNNLCTDTAQNMLSVYPVPLSLFDITNNYENIQGQILLDNLSENAVRYEWDMGNGTSSELFEPVVRYEDDGTYLIELIAWNNNNCPDTAYMEYTIVFQGLYVPTGFTPDYGDAALREFKPAGMNLKTYQLTVINEWGNIVFQSNALDGNGSPMEGWDGTVNQEAQPTGTYMWTISATFQDGTIWNGTNVGDGNTKTYGTVLLIR
jgi:PKD repeat protein